jgi:hypothetical protein
MQIFMLGIDIGKNSCSVVGYSPSSPLRCSLERAQSRPVARRHGRRRRERRQILLRSDFTVLCHAAWISVCLKSLPL